MTDAVYVHTIVCCLYTYKLISISFTDCFFPLKPSEVRFRSHTVYIIWSKSTRNCPWKLRVLLEFRCRYIRFHGRVNGFVATPLLLSTMFLVWVRLKVADRNFVIMPFTVHLFLRQTLRVLETTNSVSEWSHLHQMTRRQLTMKIAWQCSLLFLSEFVHYVCWKPQHVNLSICGMVLLIAWVLAYLGWGAIDQPA